MSNYHCPSCGKDISFGESICPHCKADVTSVWEQASGPKKETPKIIPGTGGMPGGATPFPPPAGGTPFPPPAGGTPFPPPAGATPFPPPAATPFPPPSPAPGTGAPFPPPSGSAPLPPPGGSAPFPPPAGAAPFPPATAAAPVSSKAFFDITRIGGTLNIPDQPDFYIGRDEIQGCATKALPDLNAYNNLSKVRKDPSGKVFKEHFIIHNKGNDYTIEDLHSTNGTYLGTTKLQGAGPQPLKDGDKVILPIEEFGKLVQLELIFKVKK